MILSDRKGTVVHMAQKVKKIIVDIGEMYENDKNEL